MVNEVLQALEIIKKEKRLRIPLQVIKEFSLNRPKQIKQRMNDVDQIISKFQADLKPIIERLSMLQKKMNEKPFRYGGAFHCYSSLSISHIF